MFAAWDRFPVVTRSLLDKLNPLPHSAVYNKPTSSIQIYKINMVGFLLSVVGVSPPDSSLPNPRFFVCVSVVSKFPALLPQIVHMVHWYTCRQYTHTKEIKIKAERGMRTGKRKNRERVSRAVCFLHCQYGFSPLQWMLISLRWKWTSTFPILNCLQLLWSSEVKNIIFTHIFLGILYNWMMLTILLRGLPTHLSLGSLWNNA